MKIVSVQLEDEHLEKLEAMVEQKECETISQGIRKCINAFPFARQVRAK